MSHSCLPPGHSCGVHRTWALASDSPRFESNPTTRSCAVLGLSLHWSLVLAHKSGDTMSLVRLFVITRQKDIGPGSWVLSPESGSWVLTSGLPPDVGSWSGYSVPPVCSLKLVANPSLDLPVPSLPGLALPLPGFAGGHRPGASGHLGLERQESN